MRSSTRALTRTQTREEKRAGTISHTGLLLGTVWLSDVCEIHVRTRRKVAYIRPRIDMTLSVNVCFIDLDSLGKHVRASVRPCVCACVTLTLQNVSKCQLMIPSLMYLMSQIVII